MKNITWFYIGIVICAVGSIPFAEAAAFDLTARSRIATSSLEHREVDFGVVSRVAYSQGDRQDDECELHVGGKGVVVEIYPISCHDSTFRISDQGWADAEVVPWLSGDRVLSLKGVRLWNGEPSNGEDWTFVVPHCVSYLSVLYLVGVAVFWRRFRPSQYPDKLAGRAALSIVPGSVVAFVAMMVLMIVRHDPMIGMCLGVVVTATSPLWSVWLKRRYRF